MMGIYGNLQYSRLTQFRSLNFPEHKQRAKCHREREREKETRHSTSEGWTEREVSRIGLMRYESSMDKVSRLL